MSKGGPAVAFYSEDSRRALAEQAEVHRVVDQLTKTQPGFW